MRELLYYNISIFLPRLRAFCKSESQCLLSHALREPRQEQAAPSASKLRGQSNIAYLSINDNDFHYHLNHCDFRLHVPLNLVMFERLVSFPVFRNSHGLPGAQHRSDKRDRSGRRFAVCFLRPTRRFLCRFSGCRLPATHCGRALSQTDFLPPAY